MWGAAKSSILGAQRAARARAEARVVGWEAKVEALRAGGQGECEAWAATKLRKAWRKVRENKDNIWQLERSVKRMEELVAQEANVKEEVEEEVVGLLGGRMAGAIMDLPWDLPASLAPTPQT